MVGFQFANCWCTRGWFVTFAGCSCVHPTWAFLFLTSERIQRHYILFYFLVSFCIIQKKHFNVIYTQLCKIQSQRYFCGSDFYRKTSFCLFSVALRCRWVGLKIWYPKIWWYIYIYIYIIHIYIYDYVCMSFFELEFSRFLPINCIFGGNIDVFPIFRQSPEQIVPIYISKPNSVGNPNL